MGFILVTSVISTPFTTVNEDRISSENVSEIVKNYEFGNDIPVKLLMGNNDIVCEP